MADHQALQAAGLGMQAGQRIELLLDLLPLGGGIDQQAFVAVGGAGSSDGTLQPPSEPVRTGYSVPRALSFTTTLAPGTTPPDVSLTTPDNVAVVAPPCADAGALPSARHRTVAVNTASHD